MMATKKRRAPDWTGEDHDAAMAEGWVISETDRVKGGEPKGYGYRPFELQKLDESDRFRRGSSRRPPSSLQM